MLLLLLLLLPSWLRRLLLPLLLLRPLLLLLVLGRGHSHWDKLWRIGQDAFEQRDARIVRSLEV